MVGLADIPCVGKIVDRISDATVEALFRGLRYLFCYKSLVEVLNSEIKKVDTEEVRVSNKILAAEADGKIIYDDALKWQKDVKEIQESTKEFLENYKNRSSWRCIHCLPIPKPVSRFHLGRQAVQNAKRVTELFDSVKDLLAKEIAYLPPVENSPTTDTVYQNFESRSDAYEKLWKALVTEGSSPVLGIYGMPGVGKTRMMERIWKEAKDQKIFDKVARADVGNENLDVIKLQEQIASDLDCHFESVHDEKRRASQLKRSLMNGGKILVILDDVWKEIPLHRIGIPSGDDSSSKHCKILLTSREENVCLKNKCMHPIKLTPLESDEAWDMFRNTVGTDNINLLQDEPLAQKVCEKCAGLPLLINAVGKALQFTSQNLWKDALDQLEKGKLENIADIDPQVYACVKLSIDRLQDDAKSCLFLCSLYPEDAKIYIRKLIQLATGSRLVPGGESRVCAMVDSLRTSSLLLDSEEGDHILKLHDLIRDVARSIAIKDPKYSFSLVRCGLRLSDDVDYRTRKLLQLHLEKNDIRFPDGGLVCPNLHNLWLQCNKNEQQFSGGLSGMFANLRFLLIEDMIFSLESQFSLQSLGNLMTLILDGCNMTIMSQTNASFFPENLETLCFWDCDLPVPLVLPNLKDLVKLEIQGSSKRKVEMVEVVRNTISSMPNLKELHVPEGVKIQDDESEISSAQVLVEISKLTELKSLQMLFERFQDTNIFVHLLEYHIRVGHSGNYYWHGLKSGVSIKRSIELVGVRSELGGLKGLIERAEEVKLYWTNIDVDSICNSNREAFADLRELTIEDCDTVEYVARISHNEIQHRRSFSKLTILYIWHCSSMKYLFNNSAARCLVQLQELHVKYCREMEAIIMNEGTSDGDDAIINFPNLKTLYLLRLPTLKSFRTEKKEMHSGSTTQNSPFSTVQARPLFDEMVTLPSLEYLNIRELGVTDIWGKHDNTNALSSSFCKLKSLYVSQCNELESSVIPLAMLNVLRNLEVLAIEVCDKLRNVFQHSSLANDMIHLKKMTVSLCEMMTYIIGGEADQQDEEITQLNDGIILFPELVKLFLWELQCLTSFCYHRDGTANTYKVHCPKLVEFEVTYCGEINLEVIELGRDDSNCQLTTLAMSCYNKIKLSCEWQLRLYNLERLTLTHYYWWRELKFQCFKRLKVLKVIESGCSTLFSFSAFESLHQLQELQISSCDFLEDIVEDARGEETSDTNRKTLRFLHLKSVSLYDLPNLKMFFHGANYECHMPVLETVKVDNCGFYTLFTCSVFRTLQQLKDLRVTNCIILEDIIEDTGGDENLDTNETIINLPQLSKILLGDLPNLKSFSPTTSYAFSMPNLSSFYLNGCPKIEKFTSLKTSTSLVTVYRRNREKDGEFGDLNDYIKEIYKREENKSNSAGESSSSNQELETERVGEEQVEENDQP